MSINLHARQHPILTLPPAGAMRGSRCGSAIPMCDEIQLPEVLLLPTSDACLRCGPTARRRRRRSRWR